MTIFLLEIWGTRFENILPNFLAKRVSLRFTFENTNFLRNKASYTESTSHMGKTFTITY
jgi:hypothetical protein